MAKEEQSSGLESLQKEVLQAQLRALEQQTQTQKAILLREEASLEETLEAVASRKEKKERAKRINAQRQSDFALDRANQRYLQKFKCQHRSGGFMGQTPITEGGGTNSFSVLHVTVLGHDKTMFIQCGRCPLKLYWRERNAAEETRMQAAAEAVRKADPKGYKNDKVWLAWEDHLWGKELIKIHKEKGLPNSTSKGATFNFEKDGVPFIPEVSGWATSGSRPM